MSKKFHMLTLLSQALVLEEEMFNEQDEKYGLDFLKDFQEEQAFLREMKMTKHDPVNDLTNIPNKTFLQEEKLKEIHRKLVIKTHPDKVKGRESDFLEIQSAYENKDTASLLSAAVNFKIEVDLSDADLDNMSHDIENRKVKLTQRKNTLRWVWGTSNKKEDAKRVIRSAMQIDENIFQDWRNKSNLSS